MGEPFARKTLRHDDLIENGFNSVILKPLDATGINNLKNNSIFLRQSDNNLCFKDNQGVVKVISLV